MVTPFLNNAQESLGLVSFEKAISFLVKTGARSVTVTGVLGESSRLTDVEREFLIRTDRQTIDRSKGDKSFYLCVGTSYSNTFAAVALSQMALELGTDGIMVSPQKDGISAPQPQLDDILILFRQMQEVCSG